jgi:hypothetical protein
MNDTYYEAMVSDNAREIDTDCRALDKRRSSKGHKTALSATVL